jgi:hypothetical protein
MNPKNSKIILTRIINWSVTKRFGAQATPAELDSGCKPPLLSYRSECRLRHEKTKEEGRWEMYVYVGMITTEKVIIS